MAERTPENNLLMFCFHNFHNNIFWAPNVNMEIKAAQGTILIKRELLLKNDGYRPWKYGADTEFLKRIQKQINGNMIMSGLFFRRVHKAPEGVRKELIRQVTNITGEEDPVIKLETVECMSL